MASSRGIRRTQRLTHKLQLALAISRPFSPECEVNVGSHICLLPCAMEERIVEMDRTRRSRAPSPEQMCPKELVSQQHDARQRHGNRVSVRWIPTSEDNKLLGMAKEQARAATQEDAVSQNQISRMKSTTLKIARSQAAPGSELPENVGRHSRRVDTTLPGKHTRQLYDRLSWKEASVLAQLRTGMARLNGYLFQINAVETDQCACGQARDALDHFLFRCRKWTAHRKEMLQCTHTHRSNMSFFLGGKPPSDDQKWKPNLEAVRASIRFAIATGRLEAT
ncbi:hypothetical protein N7536_000143 [Penicillium majusculum]|nr:hypothetical protein N7536_000143 [Penicillium majusculum]